MKIKIRPIYEDQIKFAYVDNSISKKILYPLSSERNLLTSEEGKLLISDNSYEIFISKLDNGRVNTVANFLDPVNTSRKFTISTVIPGFTYNLDVSEKRPIDWPSKDSIDSVKSRIQITQNLDDIYSFYTILILSEGFEDFFKYYGSLLRVDFKGQISEKDKREELLKECNNYLKNGISDISIFKDVNGEYFEYPIRFRRSERNPDVVLGIQLDVHNYKQGIVLKERYKILNFLLDTTSIIYKNISILSVDTNLKKIFNRLWRTENCC